MLKIDENITDVYFFTGNVLNMNEIKRKVGQTPTQEVLQALHITLGDFTFESQNEVMNVNSTAGLFPTVVEDPKELTTGVKLFIPVMDSIKLKEAVDKVLAYLELDYIDSVVLANPVEDFELLLESWKQLEAMVIEQKIQRIGVSDIDTTTFINLYNRAEVKPNIIQISLAICCVVPPDLQEFTKKHEIQLLTHNDPKENLLPKSALNDVFGEILGGRREVEMSWAARFVIHVKCRGVLTTKGYIIGLNIKN